jgi:hypothetical protein
MRTTQRLRLDYRRTHTESVPGKRGCQTEWAQRIYTEIKFCALHYARCVLVGARRWKSESALHYSLSSSHFPLHNSHFVLQISIILNQMAWRCSAAQLLHRCLWYMFCMPRALFVLHFSCYSLSCALWRRRRQWRFWLISRDLHLEEHGTHL